MDRGIGEFVVQGMPLASLALETSPEKETVAALQSAFSINRYRTVEQDAAFGIRQIVDMALRALSPSVNDSTTAVLCLDYLTAILARLARREIPSPHRYEEGILRVITVGPTFAGMVADSFDQIRESAQGNVAVMLRMLDALDAVASLTVSPGRRRALHEQVQSIAELAERTIESPHDQVRFGCRLARVRATFHAD
jgi:uncharacterized membrane protein